MRKVAVFLGGVLLLFVVAGGAFYGGMGYERTQRQNIQERFFAERGLGPGGPQGSFLEDGPQAYGDQGNSNIPPGQTAFGRGAGGMVKSLEGDTLLLSTPQDVTTVILSDQTVIRRLVVGETTDLHPGQRVIVTGERADDGTITATSVQILAEEP